MGQPALDSATATVWPAYSEPDLLSALSTVLTERPITSSGQHEINGNKCHASHTCCSGMYMQWQPTCWNVAEQYHAAPRDTNSTNMCYDACDFVLLLQHQENMTMDWMEDGTYSMHPYTSSTARTAICFTQDCLQSLYHGTTSTSIRNTDL